MWVYLSLLTGLNRVEKGTGPFSGIVGNIFESDSDLGTVGLGSLGSSQNSEKISSLH